MEGKKESEMGGETAGWERGAGSTQSTEREEKIGEWREWDGGMVEWWGTTRSRPGARSPGEFGWGTSLLEQGRLGPG